MQPIHGFNPTNNDPDTDHVVALVNSRFNDAIPGLRTLSLTDFGPDYKAGMSPADLIVHRLTKKWQVPSSEGVELRSNAALLTFLKGETRCRDFTFDFGDNRWLLQRASYLLHQWLRKFKPSSVIEIPTGATYVPTQQQVSLRQKLGDLRHWTVTYSASSAAASLVYNCRGLRAMACEHLSGSLISFMDVVKTSQGWNSSPKELFVQMVQKHLFTHVASSRYAAVPKNNETDRAICVGAMFNTILERQYGIGVRLVLKNLNNDLETGQQIHRLRIAAPVATIDFEDASGSHLLRAFEIMFPPHFVEGLKMVRSRNILLPDGTEQVLHKLASMGSGFTFEVMTILLLAIGRCLDPQCTVYGDDVIIANNQAEKFISACRALGWVINTRKTFINSPFRESCGSYYHDDFGFIKSYDMHWCKNLVDVITLCNKLRELIDWLSDFNGNHPEDNQTSMLLKFLSRLHKDVTLLVPSSFKGPCSYSNDRTVYYSRNAFNKKGKYITFNGDLNSRYVEVDNFVRKQRRSARCLSRFQKQRGLIEYVQQEFNVEIVGLTVLVDLVPEHTHKIQGELTSCHDIYSVLKGVNSDSIYKEGKLRFSVYTVDSENQLTLLSYYRRHFISYGYCSLRR